MMALLVGRDDEEPAPDGEPAGPNPDGAMSPNLKKILVVAVVALVLFFLITQPHESADTVHRVLGWLKSGAQAIVTFVKSLFS
jgi:hypothetical protein